MEQGSTIDLKKNKKCFEKWPNFGAYNIDLPEIGDYKFVVAGISNVTWFSS